MMSAWQTLLDVLVPVKKPFVSSSQYDSCFSISNPGIRTHDQNRPDNSRPSGKSLECKHVKHHRRSRDHSNVRLQSKSASDGVSPQGSQSARQHEKTGNGLREMVFLLLGVCPCIVLPNARPYQDIELYYGAYLLDKKDILK